MITLFHYCNPLIELSNGLLSGPKGDIVQKLSPLEVDVQTFYFGVHKNFGVSYSEFMFRVHHILINGIGYFHYFTPW